MTRLRFIKSWGPHKPGDPHEPKNANTVHMLVDVYKVAVIEPNEPITSEAAPEPKPDIYKYVRKPHGDKMLKGPDKAKGE